MKKPLISVLMPVYNAEKYLKEAIESILNQTFTDFEFIIINDGSTDASEEIILSYHDPRIIYVKNETNLKLIKTLNKGLKLAKGKYIARMDADDIAFPERLQKQYDYMEKHKEITVLGTATEIIDSNGNILESNKTNITSPDTCEWVILYSAPVTHPSVMFRKKDILAVGGYSLENEALHTEDTKLWMTLIEHNYKLSNLDEVLIKYRVHNNNISKIYRDLQYRNRVFNTQKHIEKQYNLKLDAYYIELLLNFHKGIAQIEPHKNIESIYFYNKIYNQIKKKYYNNDLFELKKLHSAIIVPLLIGYRKENLIKFCYYLFIQTLKYPHFLKRLIYVIQK